MYKLKSLLIILTAVQQSACLTLPEIWKPSAVSSHEDAEQPGLLRLLVSRSTRQTSIAGRQVQDNLANEGPFYFVDVLMGAPAQTTRVTFDTGSSDLWVDPVCSTSAAAWFCNSVSTYSASSSSTKQDLGKTFSLTYAGGTVSGEWYSDIIALSKTGTDFVQQFGVATKSSGLYTGLMGLGFGNGYFTNYNNIIDSLASAGVINTKAFSLDLGSASTSEGSVIFGGIDSMKFSGTLTRVAIVPAPYTPDGLQRYYIAMTGYGQTRTSTGSTTLSSSTYRQVVVLDSGSTYSYLPSAVVNALLTATGMTYTSVGGGQYSVSCNYASDTTSTVDFTFGGATIKVPYSSFIFNNGQTCYFGAIASDSGLSVLGDTFLRAAYVVFDQTNMAIWLAQGANCGTKLSAIAKGSSGITSMVGGCAGASTTAKTTTTSAKATSLSTSAKVTTTSSTSSAKVTTTSKATTSTSTKPTTTMITTTAKTSTTSSCHASTTTFTPSAVTQTITRYGLFAPAGAFKTATTFLATSTVAGTSTITGMASCTPVVVVVPAVTVVVTTTRYIFG